MKFPFFIFLSNSFFNLFISDVLSMSFFQFFFIILIFRTIIIVIIVVWCYTIPFNSKLLRFIFNNVFLYSYFGVLFCNFLCHSYTLLFFIFLLSTKSVKMITALLLDIKSKRHFFFFKCIISFRYLWMTPPLKCG